ELRTERVNAILGTSLTTNEVVRQVRSLNIEPVSRKAKVLKCRIPSYRVDLEREIDLIEEVARVYGYDNVEEKSTASIDFSHPFAKSQFSDDVRSTLIGFGYHEAISYTLQDTKTSEESGVTPVRLLGLQSSETAAMRTSLVPGLLTSVARNASFGTDDVRLFEIGKVYCQDESSQPKLVEHFLEEERICLLLSGKRAPQHWSVSTELYDIFDLKGEVSDLVLKFALDKSSFICYPTSNRLADNAIAIEINGSYAGYMGNVAAEVLKRFGIEQEVFVAEILVEALSSVKRGKQYSPLPRYPKVRRDVAFVVDESTSARSVEDIIRSASSSLLQAIDLFDVYRGENLSAGKKSLAFGLDLMSLDRTLTDEDIESEVKSIVEEVIRKSGAVLRAV
ncbi:MAG TPA: hypothetical protein DGH68_04065, partial [Bacteroidetes bacterium]|nr:hypothetical protein [Bacteroidota bacterium]